MAFADLIVVKIMRRRNFNGTRSLFRVGMFVGNNGNRTAANRNNDIFADNVFITFVFIGNGDGRIAEQRFGTRCRNRHKASLFPFDGIIKVPHFADDFALFDFQIGNRRLQIRIPVNQTFRAVNQSFFIQRYKLLTHGAAKSFVHCKTFARPIQRSPQTAQLIGDLAAGFGFPFPDLFNKLFTSQIMSGNAVFGQQTFNDHLRGNTGMIRAGLP